MGHDGLDHKETLCAMLRSLQFIPNLWGAIEKRFLSRGTPAMIRCVS